MKKLFFVLILLAITGIGFAMIPPTSFTALNASTYTAITVPITNTPTIDFAAVTDDNSGWWIANNEAGTGAGFVTAAPGSIAYGNVTPEPNGTIFWAKAAAGTPNLSIFLGKVK